MNQKYTIGSRGSDLALWQANHVKNSLESLFPGIGFEIRIIRTTGDDQLEVALSKIGDKGLFTRQIETELLNGAIDLAVHSLKDLQTEQPEGLTIGAFCEREIANDLFVSDKYARVDELPNGAKVATGSLRRRSQLLNYRPDLQIEEIRGNVPTRLNKFAESDLDAMILAFAGVHRLGLMSDKYSRIPIDKMLPAVGQGAVAVEVRADDADVLNIVGKLDHEPTRFCVTAERAFLRRLEGGCQVPIGAHATIENGVLNLNGLVGSLDGGKVYRSSDSGSPAEAETIGRSLAEKLIEMGADKLLEETRELPSTTAGAVI